MPGSSNKRVVIFGGGMAGVHLAKDLARDAAVTLVDPNDYFEVPMAAPRSLVRPEFAEQSVIPYAAALPGVHFVQGTLAEMSSNGGAVQLRDGRQTTVRGDIHVLCTGSKYANDLMRSAGAGVQQRKRLYQRYQQTIESARQILIVGGGPIGVEVAGEISEAYPAKSITVLEAGPRIPAGTSELAAQHAVNVLSSRGVSILVGERLQSSTTNGEDIFAGRGEATTTSGRKLAYDLMIWCTGGRPNTAYMATRLSSALDERGRIRVNPDLRVIGHESLFALGDITDLDENKMAWHIGGQVRVAVDNIRRLLHGHRQTSNLPNMPARRLTIQDEHPPTQRHFDHASRVGGRGPGCLAALSDVARRRGVSTARLLAGTGLAESDLANPGCVIPHEAEHHAIENLIALCGDGGALGLEVGARYRFTTLGPLGFAMVSGSTLADATRLVLDYADLFDPFVTLELQGDESRFGVTVRPRLVSPELVRFVTERAVSALLTTWRDIARRDLLPHSVSFAFARPAADEPYSRLTGLRVGFAATHTCLSMDADDMALPLAHADAYAVRAAEAQCRQLRDTLRDRSSVAGRVKTLLRAHSEGMPDMVEVAATLCMSERTLRRRLQKDDTTFAALSDEIRRSTAEQLLSCSHLPIEHIADRLGYAGPASFINAFKRWKGRTPGAFRSALPSGATP